MSSLKCATLALLANSLLASASVPTFYNSGTKSGWSDYNEEHRGTVTEVDNVYAGDSGTSLKMIQIYDSDYSGRYHSEAKLSDAYTVGDEGYYAFSFKLQSTWDTSSGQTYVIAQTITDFTDDPNNDCGDTWLPSMMLWIQGDQLVIRRKGNNMCGPWDNGYDQQLYTIGTISPGPWHRVILQANWQSSETGFYKVWLDGEQKLDESNVITTYIDDGKDRHFQFRVGLYANSWYDDGKLVGSGNRQLWIDEVSVGTEFPA